MNEPSFSGSGVPWSTSSSAARRFVKARSAFALGLLGLVWAACAETSTDAFSRFTTTHNTLSSQGLVQKGPLQAVRMEGDGKAKLPIDLDAGCTTLAFFGESDVRDVHAELENHDGTVVARALAGAGLLRACIAKSDSYVLKLTGQKSGSYTLGTWVGGSAGSAPMVSGLVQASASAKGTCEDPLPLDHGTITGDTKRGSSDNDASCASNSAKELVYRFEIPARKHFVAETDPRYDSVLYLRKENCTASDAEVACNDDTEGGRASRLDEVLEAGTYFLFVDGTSGEEGTFRLKITETEVPALKEACDRAPALSPGVEVRGAALDVDQLHTQSCGDDAKGPEKYFKLDVPARMRVRAVLHSDDYAPVVHLRAECTQGTKELLCGDASVADNEAAFVGEVDQGSYFVIADSKDKGSKGRFRLQADLAPLLGSGVAHDTCGDAEQLSILNGEATANGDTFDAKDDVKASCAGAAGGDVFYRFDIAKRTHLSASLPNEEGEHILSLQRSCSGATLACGSVVEETLDPGSYYLVVDSAQDKVGGRFHLALKTIDVGPKETACRTAPLLHAGAPVRGTTRGARDDFAVSCNGRAGAPDKVYRMVLAQRAKVELVLETPTYDADLAVRKGCFDTSGQLRRNEVACNDDDHENEHRSRIEQVMDAGTYFVVVDGNAPGQEGDFALTLRTSAP